MSRSRIIIRVDANKQIGLGHFVRCLALAHILSEIFEVIFIFKEITQEIINSSSLGNSNYYLINENLEMLNHINPLTDIIILDGYGFGIDYQRAIKSTGCKLVCIDDMHSSEFDCDLIINHGPNILVEDYNGSTCTKFALGHKYLLLRKPFLDAIHSNRRFTGANNLLIVFGGSDIRGLTLKLLQLGINNHFEKTSIVLGSASEKNEEFIPFHNIPNIEFYHNVDADELVQIIQKSDISICTPSGVSYEMATVGLGLVLCKVIDNQEYFFDFFIKNELAIGYSVLEDSNISKLIEIILGLKRSPETVKRQIRNQKLVFSHNSTESFQKLFRDL